MFVCIDSHSEKPCFSVEFVDTYSFHSFPPPSRRTQQIQSFPQCGAGVCPAVRGHRECCQAKMLPIPVINDHLSLHAYPRRGRFSSTLPANELLIYFNSDLISTIFSVIRSEIHLYLMPGQELRHHIYCAFSIFLSRLHNSMHNFISQPSHLYQIVSELRLPINQII